MTFKLSDKIEKRYMKLKPITTDSIKILYINGKVEPKEAWVKLKDVKKLIFNQKENIKEFIRLLKEKAKLKIKSYKEEHVKIQKCNLGSSYTKEEKEKDNLKILNRIIALKDFIVEIDKIKKGMEVEEVEV